MADSFDQVFGPDRFDRIFGPDRTNPEWTRNPAAPKPQTGIGHGGIEPQAAPPLPDETLKAVTGKPPPPPVAQSVPSYLGHGLESGLYAVAGMAGEAGEAFNPVSAARNAWLDIKDAAHQILSGTDTNANLKMKAAKDASTPFTRFAERMQRESQELSSTPDGEKYNQLRYATTDPAKSALLSPIRMVHDALQSLPSTAAMAATVYLTRGAAVKGYSEAIAAGFSKSEANAIAVKAAGRVASLAGAFGEGTVGGLQQETQQRVSVLDGKEPTSPIYLAMVKAGVSKEDARQYVATESGTEAGAAAGAVDAATNLAEGPILGRIVGEGGNLAPRVAKGVAAEGTQEGVQGVGEQVGQNLAQRRFADPKQQLADGVAENMLASFAVGGLTGGAFAGVGGAGVHSEHLDKGAALVTPEDQASPLPTDLIQQGKGAIAQSLEAVDHNGILAAHGAPAVGTKVAVTRGPDAAIEQGNVLGAFSIGDAGGQEHGIRVGMNDGSTYEELFKDIQSGGHSINALIDKYLPEAAGTDSSQIRAEGVTQPESVPDSNRVTSADVLKAKIGHAENATGDPNAKNPLSSASSRYQFTDGTWKSLGGDLARKNDPAEQERLMDKLIAQNSQALDKAGIQTNAGNLYLAHFLGAQGAIDALAKPNEAVDAKVQKSNPFAAGWTNAQLASWANRKMGGKAGAYTSNPNTAADRAWAERDKGADGEELKFPEEEAAPPAKAEGPSYSEKARMTMPDGTERDISAKPELGPTSGDPGGDVGQAAVLRAIEEGRHSWKHDAGTSGYVNWAMRTGYAEPVKGGKLKLTDSGQAKVAEFNAAGVAGAPRSSEQATEAQPTTVRDGFKTPQEAGLYIKAQKLETGRFQVEGYGEGNAASYRVIDTNPAPAEQPEWVNFPPGSGTLGIPRADMPQVKGEHRGALVNFLQARGVTANEATVAADSLKPTQAEYSPAKVASWDNGNMKIEDRSILVSSDNHILDGHHQWVKAKQDGGELRIMRLNKPIRELLPLVHEFPSSKTSEGATSPQDALKAKVAGKRDLKQAAAEHAVSLYPKSTKNQAAFVAAATGTIEQPFTGTGEKARAWAANYQREREAEARKPLRRPLTGKEPQTLDEALDALRAMRGAPAIDNYDSSRNHASHALSILKERGLAEASRLAASTLSTGQRLNAHEQRAFEILRDATPGTETPENKTSAERARAAVGPRVFVNHVGLDGQTDAERGRALTDDEKAALRETADQPSEAPIGEAAATNIREQAAPYQGELAAWADKTRFGEFGKFIDPGVKSVERIVEKAVNEGYASVHELKDIVRGGFVVDTQAHAELVAAGVRGDFNLSEDKGWKAVTGGYFDLKLIVEFKGGVKGEVQIIPAPIYKAKFEGGLEKVYNQAREIPGFDSENPPPEAAKLIAQMIEGYANAASGTSWASRFKEAMDAYAARNSFAKSVWERIEPSFVTSPEAGTQRSDELNTKANPLPSDTPLATGRPSISKNDSASIPPHIVDSDYGARNTLVTRARADELRAKLNAKLGTQLNSGIDPEIIAAGSELAVFHIEAGARKFADFARSMLADLGEKARPFLRAWYEAVRYYPGAEALAPDMSGPEEIGAALAQLATESTRGTLQPEEKGNASASETSSTGAHDRAGDAGRSAGAVSRAEGERRAGDGAAASGRGSDAELPAGVEPGNRSDGQVERPSAAEGRQASDAAERGGTDRNRPGRRVRGTSKGTDFRASAGSLKRTGSWKATAERNLDIVQLVKTLEAEGRQATPDEQALLAKFTGWGASEIRNGLFPDHVIKRDQTTGERKIVPGYSGEWKPLQERAAELLKGPDLEEALQSTQYAHYTSPEVIRSIWDGLERLGFAGGKILEPGMGIGNFFMLAPEGVHDGSHYTGIELDGFTAKIAKYLLPQENVTHGDYTKTRLPNGFFDVALGNPPFSQTKILDDPDYKKQRFSLHDYFFAKSIDKVRPGGLLVFVTSRYTMDKLEPKAREYIAARADLLGAVRLPQTAFKENAGTEVVTDVLFLQRRGEGVAPAGEAWTATDQIKVGGQKFQINEYFKRHPEMVLGRHAMIGSMYRTNDYTVEPYATGSIEKRFADAVKSLPEGTYAEAPRKAVEAARARTFERDFAPASSKEGGLYVKDGRLFVVDQGSGVEAEQFAKLSASDKVWLKGYTKLRDALKAAQKDQLEEGEWEKSLAALNREYRAFTKKHGQLLSFTKYDRTFKDADGEQSSVSYKRFHNQRLFDLDIESPLVVQLEKITDEDEVKEGAFLQGRTLNKPTRPKIETPQDALAVTLDEVGRLDLDYVAKLLGRSRDQVTDELGDGIFEHPSDGWQTSDEYLSGLVIDKLEEAQTAAAIDPKYERNVAALLKVQPKPLPHSAISVKLGAGWIPAESVRQFVTEELGLQNAGISYDRTTAHWTVEGSNARYMRSNLTDYGTPDRSPLELLDAVLNNRTIKITRTENIDGSKKTYTDDKATAAANEAAKKIIDKFKSWIWTDAKRAGELQDIYNRQFNNLAPRSFNGDHLTLPGLSANFAPHPHVKRAVWRIIQSGNTYLGHAVGAGKTAEQIISAMEQKRLGLIKKPMFAVPNHMLQQFAREFLELYPAANIMVADERAFHTGNRRRFMAQAALNDPDAIIVTHSSFGKLGVSQKTKDEFVQDMMLDLENALEEVKGEGNEGRLKRKKIEQQLEQMKRRIEGKSSAKDQTLNFEEMGVDQLYVDEGHEFRKLDFATNRQAKGIDSAGSAKALDLYIKTRWLEKQNPGRSLVMASGTPVTNTMAELYTVMRYMDEKALDRDGLKSFDAWANTFGEVAAGYEQNAAGGYEIVERFAKFVNVPELMKRVRSFMDVLTSDQLGGLVERPSWKGGLPKSEVVSASPHLERYMKQRLQTRLVTSRAWKPSRDQPGNPDPVINIITDARLASIDMRFALGIADDPGSKLNKMIDNIIAIHKATAGNVYSDPKTGVKDLRKGAVQIVFSAVGFGEAAMKNRGFDVRGWVDGRLMKAGIRKSEIAWMSDATSHAKKDALQKAVRSGQVRVLIGSPKNMGTGLNVQRRLYALHFLSPPWYPSDVEQPHGRIVRQGNLHGEVEGYWYATKGTYDSTAWGMVSRKQKFIEQAMLGDDSVRTLEDISESSQYEMAAALAAGDERVIKVAGLSGDVERLTRLRGAHADLQRQLRSDRNSLEKYSIPSATRNVAELEQANSARGSGFFDFSFDKFDSQKEAGEHVIATIEKALNDSVAVPRKELGKLYGKFPVTMEPAERVGAAFTVSVDVGGHVMEAVAPRDEAQSLDPVGLMTRIVNKVRAIPTELADEKRRLADAQTQIVQIDKKLGAPFEFDNELSEKIAEREQLQAEMAAETAAQQGKVQSDDTTGVLASAGGPEMGRRDFLKGAAAVTGGFMLNGRLYATPAGLTSILRDTTKGPIPAQQAVQWIAANSQNPSYRAMAKKILPLIRGVTLRSVEWSTPAGMNSEYGAWVYWGSDRTPENKVPDGIGDAAHGLFYTGLNGKDQIWLARTNKQQEIDGWNEATVIHESLHAAVSRYYGMLSVRAPNPRAQLQADGYDREAFPRSDRADQAVEEIRSIWKEAVARWKSQGEGAETNLNSAVVDRLSNGLQNTDEFIAYALADENLQQFLKQMPTNKADERSLWQRLVDAIRSLFGMGAVSRSALDDVMDATNALLDEVRDQPAVQPGRANRKSGDNLLSAAGAISPSSPEFGGSTEQRWQEASKGIGAGPGIVDKTKGWFEDLKAGFSRHWRDLPNEPRFAAVQQKLRQLEAAHDSALEETVRHLRDLVGKLNEEDRDLLARKVVLDDLMWEAGAEHELPFGFTPESLREARARIDSILQTKPDLTAAVRKRKLVNRRLADEMVNAGVLTPEQVKNPAYYRHMVLDFARAEARLARSGKVKSPYWAKRMGSSLDINANLLEAEFDWMMKAKVDVATARTIEWIKGSEHNIRDALRKQAKDSNAQGMAEIIHRDPQARKLDGLFRSNVKRGMDFVKAAIESGELAVPPHLEAAAEALVAGSSDANVFPLLTHILDENRPGAMGAAMVLSAVGRRKAWEKASLGKAWVDPDDIKGLVEHFHPEGFSAWQPREGQHLFTAKSMSEHALDMFVSKLSEPEYPGVDKAELEKALQSVRPQLVVGGDRYTMVVPSELALTLDGYGDRRMAGMVAQVFGELQGAWKRWVLINPRRFFKYNLNNMSGDLDAIIAGKPSSLLNVGQAAKELYAVWRGKAQPSEPYKQALERGVFTSGLSAQEIPDINALAGIHHLLRAKSLRPDRMMVQAAANVWHGLQGATNFREAVFRYAAYLKFKDELDQGVPQAKIGYAASVPNMVDAVEDHADRAALLARDLVGDYGSISAAGSWIRRYLVPFWSWAEINTKRYWRLTANGYRSSKARGALTGGLLGTGIAVRTGAYLYIRMALMYALLNLWNDWLFGDDEKKLSDDQRRQLHLILGRDSSGNVVTIRLQGALSDVLGELGFPDAIAGLKKWENGQGTIGQAVTDTLKAPINRVVPSVSPVFSTPLELALGEDFWPDMFNPRQIHDNWRHVFQTFNLENEYDAVRDKPSRGYGRSWTESLVYRRDPGEMSYDEARSIAHDWLRDVKGEASRTFGDTPRGEALRDYKLALRYGDEDAARAALERYAEYGGTSKGLKLSERAADPLHAIPKKERREFVASLTDDQLQTFRDAESWYAETYLGRKAQR